MNPGLLAETGSLSARTFAPKSARTAPRSPNYQAWLDSLPEAGVPGRPSSSRACATSTSTTSTRAAAGGLDATEWVVLLPRPKPGTARGGGGARVFGYHGRGSLPIHGRWGSPTATPERGKRPRIPRARDKGGAPGNGSSYHRPAARSRTRRRPAPTALPDDQAPRALRDESARQAELPDMRSPAGSLPFMRRCLTAALHLLGLTHRECYAYAVLVSHCRAYVDGEHGTCRLLYRTWAAEAASGGSARRAAWVADGVLTGYGHIATIPGAQGCGLLMVRRRIRAASFPGIPPPPAGFREYAQTEVKTELSR